MKAAFALAAIVWLAASVFVGYRLAARSFAWIDAVPAPSAAERGSAIPDIDALKARLPEIASDPEGWLRQLTVAQQACLEKLIAPERYRAALENREFTPTLAELRAAATCLK